MEDEEVDVYVLQTKSPNTLGLQIGDAVAVLTVEQAREIGAALFQVIQEQDEAHKGVH